jgi:leucyl aminopeptidase (aminopeptidase T)
MSFAFRALYSFRFMTYATTAHAASVLVQSALKLRAGERVVLVEDADSVAVADATAGAAEACGAWVKRCRLDRMTTGDGSARPHKVMPELLLLALHDADASVFLASAPPAELSMRQALLHVVRQRRLRHAHMPGITEATFAAGMRLDYEQVQRLGARVLTRLAGARVLVSESAAGTSLMVALPPDARWLAQLGVLEAGEWGNLPAGALYASPADVSGVFVADASLGEFFGAREGLLRPNPVRFLIDGGRVVDVQARSGQLRRDIESMLAVSPNSDRVGLVAIGVNAGIDVAMGDVLLDQNVPGLHLGIGDPAARATGAGWSAPTCFAACQAVSRVLVDGELIAEQGRIVLPTRTRMPPVRIHTPVTG